MDVASFRQCFLRQGSNRCGFIGGHYLTFTVLDPEPAQPQFAALLKPRSLLGRLD